MDFYMFDG